MNQKYGKRRRRRETDDKKGTAFQNLVGEVIQAFSPNTAVKVGEWVEGPDGERDMDVHVRRQHRGRDELLIIECKDYTYSKRPTRVGVGDIDKLDSVRTDFNAQFALLASNSGFTKMALQKAKRVKIGAISVLKSGDPRAKAEFKELAWIRKCTPIWDEFGMVLYDDKNEPIPVARYRVNQTYLFGELIEDWLFGQTMRFQMHHPWCTDRVRLSFKFSQSAVPTHEGATLPPLSAMDVVFRFQTQWSQQIVSVQVAQGIVSHLEQKVIFKESMELQGINFDTMESSEPPLPEEYLVDFRDDPNGVAMMLMTFENIRADLNLPNPSKISEAVDPHDMETIHKPLGDELKGLSLAGDENHVGHRPSLYRKP